MRLTQYREYEIIVCEMAAILSRGQGWVIVDAIVYTVHPVLPDKSVGNGFILDISSNALIPMKCMLLQSLSSHIETG